MKTNAWSIVVVALLLAGCGGGTEEATTPPDGEGLGGEVASLEFDTVTLTIAGGAPQEVHLNGLPVEALAGADKVSSDTWEVVQRRGVRFSDIFAAAGVTVADDVKVNCVARDGFDPLRTRLGGDPSGLPTYAFVRDHGYVYVGSPGDKDPLYPEMEGRSLIVDYDLASDAEVPAELGGALASLGMFRWKMIERLDEAQRGVIELDPVVP